MFSLFQKNTEYALQKRYHRLVKEATQHRRNGNFKSSGYKTKQAIGVLKELYQLKTANWRALNQERNVML